LAVEKIKYLVITILLAVVMATKFLKGEISNKELILLLQVVKTTLLLVPQQLVQSYLVVKIILMLESTQLLEVYSLLDKEINL